MALYRFRNLDRYGRYRTKIFHHPDGEDFKYPKKGLANPNVNAQAMFKDLFGDK